MGVISLVLFLVIIPGIIGLAGTRIISTKEKIEWTAALPMGFFLELSLFQLLTFPWALQNFTFSSLCYAYIITLIICSTISISFIRKHKIRKISKPFISPGEWIYGIIAILLIGLQVYNMVHMDIGYWSSDDALYGSMANDVLYFNMLNRHDAFTGVATIFNFQRALQTSVVFPAFLAYVSGFSVAMVYHTILGVYYLVLAYLVYMVLGKLLFETMENVYIFLIVLSILYIFGLYTIYSQTYRLLGPSTQGKAVLAVCFFPFLYALLICKLHDEYDRRFGIVLLLLSIAVSSMTLFGTITMIGNIVFPVVISIFGSKHKYKNLRYILWGSVMPVFYCGIFFYSRFAP